MSPNFRRCRSKTASKIKTHSLPLLEIKVKMASTTATSTSFHSLTSLMTPRRATPLHHALPSSVTFRRPLPSISAVHSTADISLPSVALTTTSTFYEVLGVQDIATCKEIKAAYRKLARVVHPDAATSNGQKDAMSAANEFILVHEAYVTLSDPRKRMDYDRMLLFKRRRVGYSPNYAVSTAKYATTSSSVFSGYTRRTWETDQCW